MKNGPIDTSLPPTLFPASDVIDAGHGLACVRLARENGRRVDRYAVVRLSDEVVLGELRWSGKGQCYVLVPGEKTIWESGALGEVGVWIRRINRQRGDGSGGHAQ